LEIRQNNQAKSNGPIYFLVVQRTTFFSGSVKKVKKEFCLTVALLLAKIQGSHTGINVESSLLG